MPQQFSIQQKLMGSAFSLGVLAETEKEANEILQVGISEIQRLENLLSEFLPESDTSRINQNAYLNPVQVSEECFQLSTLCYLLFLYLSVNDIFKNSKRENI